uniref:Uncharacterized protein n=1 Tax=Rhizophora mucronata TaxID=61149 RepID=A0A2P2JUW6_RHIMU
MLESSRSDRFESQLFGAAFSLLVVILGSN